MGEIITAGHRNHEEINEILTKYAAKMWAAEARIAGAEAMMDAMVMGNPIKPGPRSKYQHVAYGLRIRPDGKTEISANTGYKLFNLSDDLQLQAHAKWSDESNKYFRWRDNQETGTMAGLGSIRSPDDESPDPWRSDPASLHPSWQADPVAIKAPESLPLLTEEELQAMWDDDTFASGRVHPDPMDYHERYIEVD